ncbi:MAG: sugar phosphate isomerase/epimerase [Chloroflexi bacterium]|nr:sugar phosphate isomerase/epimerase [Chloroflexota bacterium]MDK1044797.1 cobamide remodeling phosphodiesterase CbiR [Anaerolineales bacterium]MCH8094457.1 sugar phosphate isomerase/epimerase [Chloroflexota bacterium]MCH8338332.1 sugar phosphate isomerase/epimerase [Chloroflexota bacterium]MCH8341302.1 sugar phosphate isomerase/epimerase [Chloroflexota bacterium]
MIPFRIGTTSYILPDEILPNVRYLADKVRDIELVLFEVDDDLSNLPSAEVISQLAELARENDLTYTVHLPLDLRLGSHGQEGHRALIKARGVMERTRPLDPWAYVVHLDGINSGAQSAWVERSARALEQAADWAGDPAHIAVENLEGHAEGLIEPVLDRVAVSRCVDVGHLWADGLDPIPLIRKALPRTRVIHLHGIAERDHRSLLHVPPGRLNPVLECLLRGNYRGVVTMEVFNEEDFVSSQAVLERAMKKLWAKS